MFPFKGNSYCVSRVPILPQQGIIFGRLDKDQRNMAKKFGSVLKNQRNILGPLNPKKGSQNGENVIITYKLLNFFINN